MPSPNVAEDHQTKNAMALVKNGAAILINDRSAEDTLVKEALALLKNKVQSEQLSANLAKMALPKADEIIAGEVLKLIK
ncbi:undecaprenyldiphospho-muramoylpentapeptide beta-N- acetylglucosaminyltransferase [compost metagenome]